MQTLSPGIARKVFHMDIEADISLEKFFSEKCRFAQINCRDALTFDYHHLNLHTYKTAYFKVKDFTLVLENTSDAERVFNISELIDRFEIYRGADLVMQYYAPHLNHLFYEDIVISPHSRKTITFKNPYPEAIARYKDRDKYNFGLGFRFFSQQVPDLELINLFTSIKLIAPYNSIAICEEIPVVDKSKDTLERAANDFEEYISFQMSHLQVPREHLSFWVTDKTKTINYQITKVVFTHPTNGYVRTVINKESEHRLHIENTYALTPQTRIKIYLDNSEGNIKPDDELKVNWVVYNL